MDTIGLQRAPSGRPGLVRTALTLLSLAVLGAGPLLAGCASDGQGASGTQSARAVKTTIVATRRITESQYRNTIADIFGPQVRVDGRFEPEVRKDGLLAIGAGQLSISDAGFAQYFAMARQIADQALPATPAQEAQKAAVQAARDRLAGCTPVKADAPDAACAEKVIRAYGERLFRRPLTAADVTARVELAGRGASQTGDFYQGLRLSLISLLTAPEFLFRIETAEADPAKRGTQRLDGYSKAARLSALMWDTAPDAELLAAAANGSIHTESGLKAQIDRLSANPARMEAGLRAFFSDMLDFEMFASLTKDPQTYPKFSLAVAESAREQTLKVLVDQLITKGGDYRDVFTTRETFMNRALSPIYKVPYTYDGEWTRMMFAPESGQSGILTQATFMMLFSHPGRSSPTIRGVKIYEIFMCLPTAPPPPDVDFSKVRESKEGTVRERLFAHANNEGCSGCHLVSDPPGLALENFDALGQWRTMENGRLIDVSVDWQGKTFQGAQGLGMAIRDDPLIPACLVRNVVAYGVGRTPDNADKAFIERKTRAFTAGGHKVPALIADIAASPEFYRVSPPAAKAPARAATKVAAN